MSLFSTVKHMLQTTRCLSGANKIEANLPASFLYHFAKWNGVISGETSNTKLVQIGGSGMAASTSAREGLLDFIRSKINSVFLPWKAVRLLKFQALISPAGSFNEPSEWFYASLACDTVIFSSHSSSQNRTMSDASPSAYKQGFSMGESLTRWQTSLLFPLSWD